MRVMFVCLGNICRSPAAQAVFDSRLAARGLAGDIASESSGTCSYHVGQQSDTRMRETAKRYGIRIDHRSRQFTSSDFSRYDLILAMDRENHTDLLRMAGSDGDRRKVRMFRSFDPEGPGDVPDPYYGGPEGFDQVLLMLLRTCDIIIDRIQEGTV